MRGGGWRCGSGRAWLRLVRASEARHERRVGGAEFAGRLEVAELRDGRAGGRVHGAREERDIRGHRGVGAQRAGYAEADPSEDLDGADAAAKLAIIAAVGERLKSTPGLGGQLLSSLGDINVEMISMGANEINLAMENGEVGGRGSNSWSSWKATKAGWLREKKINIILQVGLERNKEIPDTPLLTDISRDDLDRAALGDAGRSHIAIVGARHGAGADDRAGAQVPRIRSVRDELVEAEPHEAGIRAAGGAAAAPQRPGISGVRAVGSSA